MSWNVMKTETHWVLTCIKQCPVQVYLWFNLYPIFGSNYQPGPARPVADPGPARPGPFSAVGFQARARGGPGPCRALLPLGPGFLWKNMLTIAQLIKVHLDIWPLLILRGHFKVTNVKIVCSISLVRDRSMLAIGHLISFDDLNLQENSFGVMSRPSHQQLGFVVSSCLAFLSLKTIELWYLGYRIRVKQWKAG